MDKEKLKKMSLSELFMLIRNASGATALSASEEIERRLSFTCDVDGCKKPGVIHLCEEHGLS
mgnify:CR=1 FL=1